MTKTMTATKTNFRALTCCERCICPSDSSNKSSATNSSNIIRIGITHVSKKKGERKRAAGMTKSTTSTTATANTHLLWAPFLPLWLQRQEQSDEQKQQSEEQQLWTPHQLRRPVCAQQCSATPSSSLLLTNCCCCVLHKIFI